MKSYTIRYNLTFKSGHTMERGNVVSGINEAEALDSFNRWVANTGDDVEFISIKPLSDTAQFLHDEYRAGTLSTIGD